MAYFTGIGIMRKLTFPKSHDRWLYLTAAALVPGIPLFYLYNRNASQGLLFRHFLIPGGVLAIISLAIYLPVSKFILTYRRAIIIIALFWAAFWFFTPIGRIIAKGNTGLTAFYLLVFIVVIELLLRRRKISRLVANTMAVLLCLLFAFNFVPGALTLSTKKIRMAYNKITGRMPYEVKTEFKVDANLPKPNIYWLHMDGMVGFDAVERYFNDPQTTLIRNLTARGFVVNKSARLEAGFTQAAIPALTSPVFYDSYLADEFARVARLTRVSRNISLYRAMMKKGFSLDDIYPQIELLKALSDAGYINIVSRGGDDIDIGLFKNTDIWIVDYGNVTVGDLSIYREADSAFSILTEFKELITDASALSVIKPKIDEIFERKKPFLNTEPLPAYQETVDKYVKGYSDLDSLFAYVVKAMKYVASIQTPHFVYFINGTAHYRNVKDTIIGDIDYGRPIGRTFVFDENGNIYNSRLDDPNDVHLYLPTHKYTVKQMMAQVDTVIEDDPNAVIIIPADHGIHGIGNGADSFDSNFMYARGYGLDDQLNLSLDVISAVRIPPQFGKLSQPLDPLDIARYLVNNFVGKRNYDYLYYKEE
jgi:hypothetical protein